MVSSFAFAIVYDHFDPSRRDGLSIRDDA